MRYLITLLLITITAAVPALAQDDCTASEIGDAMIMADFVVELGEFYTDIADNMTDDNTATYFSQAIEKQREWIFEVKPDLPECNQINYLIRYVDDNVATMQVGLFYVFIENFDDANTYIDFSAESMDRVTEISSEIVDRLN